MHLLPRVAVLLSILAPPALAQQSVPMLPDSAGWGVQVLTDVTAPGGARWVGTYAEGIFVLRRGARAWDRIRTDTTDTSISMDFVNAIAFGPRGEVWYGTVGNGWGVSTDGGRSWRNWTIKQLGPEWQYVTPEGISTKGDTTVIGTADGIQVTTDNGEHWTALIDGTGPPARGPADSAVVLLDDEYVLALSAVKGGWSVRTLTGTMVLAAAGGKWRRGGAVEAGASARAATLVKGKP
ncbi:MAG: Photosynthesis system assembly factor, partial [Gemmatimonadetes bacterium]|nr:Photosynthesis system assembly factor [Gemmatimonadota bacterium]